jgi:predicted nucleic acid-binding protein
MACVCLDASLVVLWFLRQELTPEADAVLDQWRADDIDLIAPPLLMAEVPSVLRQAVHRGRITSEEGDTALADFVGVGIRIAERPGLLRRTWDLGKALNVPRLYDMFYVALADMEHCELWTADRHLVNLVKGRWPLARWLGDFSTQAETARTSEQHMGGHAT